jgi:hypothetical protein
MGGQRRQHIHFGGDCLDYLSHVSCLRRPAPVESGGGHPFQPEPWIPAAVYPQASGSGNDRQAGTLFPPKSIRDQGIGEPKPSLPNR